MRKIPFIFFLTLFAGSVASAQPPAFPGAEGGGKFTTGGRGGKVLFVDNLNNKGPGSLRKAVEARGPRTVIFRISGTIELEKPIYIKNDSITIAGQTAPGDGICLKNYGIQVEADEVIIRYIRIRPGDGSGEQMDAISGTWHKNIIIDHCSFSWSNDETASFYNNRHFTMQWCIISESLNKSSHTKGEHGYGGIWGGLDASFHHNLISDHTSRNPRFCGSRYSNNPLEEMTDFRNNVIYNWGNNSVYGGEEGYYNLVNNYFKPGPATGKSSRKRLLELTLHFYDPRHNTDTLGAGWFYIKGNVMEGSGEVTRNNWKYGVQGDGVDDAVKKESILYKPVRHTKVKTTGAAAAFRKVLREAGANLHRDAVDRRVLEEARCGMETFGETFREGGKGIIDSPSAVGGWPRLKTQPAPPDSDNDGMPDEWEIANQLNRNDPTDHVNYSISKNYTNLEVYMNKLVGEKKKAD